MLGLKSREEKRTEARERIRNYMKSFDGRRFVTISLGQTVDIGASGYSIEEILNIIPKTYHLINCRWSGSDHLGYCFEILAELK